ncbi:hypothetical protein [Pseudoduganella sp. RAF53_2]|uniref:hypothetical protein n=1 Tax=unclassified Pseudoduganella TaxID=2637179 RepID=UPI003F98D207
MRIAALVLCLACAPACAKGLKPLSDETLSAVRGGDGVSFDLSGFSMNGTARATFTASPGYSIWKENFSAARSDSPVEFSDPYRLDVISGAAGLADVIRFSLPTNTDASQKWQFAYDLGVEADGITRNAGSFVFNDVVFQGGGWQFSTPRVSDGVAFGLGLRMDIGQFALRPAGRDNAGEQIALQGIHIGEVDADGNFTGAPWKIADVASQPAVINAVADENGPRLHIGIDWPDARYGSGQAATGGIQIDKISFTSPATGTTDLGSSRIGSIQIQYLDIKFRQ